MISGIPLLLRVLDVIERGDAEIMNQIAVLPVIPPTQRVPPVKRAQGGLGLFDLGLHTPMCQCER